MKDGGQTTTTTKRKEKKKRKHPFTFLHVRPSEVLKSSGCPVPSGRKKQRTANDPVIFLKMPTIEKPNSSADTNTSLQRRTILSVFCTYYVNKRRFCSNWKVLIMYLMFPSVCCFFVCCEKMLNFIFIHLKTEWWSND